MENDILQALKSELDWCNKHEPEKHQDFIRGIEQAIFIVKNVIKTRE